MFDQHFDISLPIPVIEKQVQIATKKLKKLSFIEHVFTFGHVADGNIHFIIGKNDNSKENTEKINQIIYSNLKENGGSVSAEHGIGLDKKKISAYIEVVRRNQLDENSKKDLRSKKNSKPWKSNSRLIFRI